MHDLPQVLNDASALAVSWLGKLDWRTWTFFVLLWIIFPHLIRELVGLTILIGAVLFVGAFVVAVTH
jgi:hypothetical protein